MEKYQQLLAVNTAKSNEELCLKLQAELNWSREESLFWIISYHVKQLQTTEEKLGLRFHDFELDLEFIELWAEEKVNALWTEKSPHYRLMKNKQIVHKAEGKAIGPSRDHSPIKLADYQEELLNDVKMLIPHIIMLLDEVV